MVRRYSQFLELVYLLVDILLLNLSFFIGLIITYETGISKIQDKKYAMLLVAVNLIWFLVTSLANYYKIDRKIGYEKIIIRFAKVISFQVLLTFAYIVVMNGDTLSRVFLAVTFAGFAVLGLIWRLAFETFMKRYRAKGGNYRRIVVVGANRSSELFVREILGHNEFGYKFLGYFDNAVQDNLAIRLQGNLNELQDYCLQNNVDELYCALDPTDHADYLEVLMHFCDDNLIRYRIIPEFSDYLSKRFKKIMIEYYGNIPIITMRPEPLDNLYNRIQKRTFDIFFALLFFLFIGWWLFPLIAILVKLSSKGPVFFKQIRSGEQNREFMCYKFRSMRVNQLADVQQATKDDPRITKIGKILRRTNLDELPQFWNVLIGDMSVVGPRPHMLKHTEEYSKIINNFMVRHFVKPGITGAAQANGYRGDTTDPEQMRKRVQYDVWYLENWSFWLDVKIVFLTVWSMIKGNENAV
jgi:Undecaprenyl-phosphate glucose phosphotransferase